MSPERTQNSGSSAVPLAAVGDLVEKMRQEPWLKAGVARATITPPVGIPLVGFAGRGPSDGFHDPLYATALALSDGRTKAVLITCDLIGLEADLVREIRAEIARRTDVPAGNVMLSCTHTHYGPAVGISHPDADVAAYVANLKFLLAGAAQEAAATRQDVRLGVGRGEAHIGVNRRERREDGSIWLGQNPAGPVDREVGVIRLDTVGGSPLATLVIFACHPVCQAGTTTRISADYPGRTREVVEQLTGAPCLFVQGAGANINPVEMEPRYEPARKLGTILGCEVVKVWENVTPKMARGLGVASQELSLPAMTFSSLEEGEAQVAELEKQWAEQQANNAPAGSLYWTETRLQRAREKLRSLQTGEPLPPIPAEVQVFRLGDVALVAAPGEVFTEIGLEVKRRSPLQDTFFAAYTNGSIGYVPVPEAYLEGGYEVSHACRVDPPAARLIVEGCLGLLKCQTGP